MDTATLQTIFELAKAQVGANRLKSDLSLEFCNRGLFGLKGDDFLAITYGGKRTLEKIKISKSDSTSFSLDDSMFKANASILNLGLTYKPNSLVEKLARSTKIRRDFPGWIPVEDRPAILSILKALCLANLLGNTNMPKSDIFKYFKKHGIIG